jgi:hypothetical protein
VSHSDSGVADDELLIGLAALDDNLERRVVAIRLLGQRDVPHLVERIRRIGDQLANSDLGALIQGVREQVQKLLDLGLECEFLAVGLGRHLKCLNS